MGGDEDPKRRKMEFNPDPRVGAAENPLHRRTLRFAVTVAAELVFPEKKLRGGHALGAGYLYQIEGMTVTEEDLKKLQKQVEELVTAGAEIASVRKSWMEAAELLTKSKQTCARDLLETRVTSEVELYECRGVYRLALHPLHASMGGLSAGRVSLVLSEPGFVASYAAEEYVPQPAILAAVREHVAFGASHGVNCVADLNKLQAVGRGRKDFVLHCEFRQESKLAEIAREVVVRKQQGKAVKVICIAGPTSSGKTTFSHKLCMYLENRGMVAKPLTVDHYYLPLDRQPKYQARKMRSDVDYDSIESMDVDLVGQHLNAIIAGKSIMTPKYNMKTGYRDEPGHQFDALPDNGILVIEGIHALNPLYTQAVDPDKVYKIFISPLTSLQLDDYNAVKTTDHRLLRRMCRDYLFRGNSASTTLGMWNNVRKGEGVWIFPHQNNADFVVNSAAEYEIPVLKTFIEPLLREVKPEDPQFSKAREVLKLLDQFASWPPHLAPPAALLREFIGEGAFDCH
eukprot:gnl/TRDRNA2_/TRDRNA2_178661_c0_seq1.p1 gnl/TRDRNA2_/TRDRNA2_178661_c0~~gnl/TRDRNA2_/TRDRNA2_178661_c0_seq1.p1  ORF type:complete len:512 (+),score=98.24 gnl/TRDRNA2_/TRDRNA2_178661_c0_seq1:72-1607(+)